MNKKHQNAFFIFGITLLAIMVTQLDFALVSCGDTALGVSISVQHLSLVSHHQCGRPCKGQFLVALQDNGIWIRSKLRHSRRTDGR